MLKLLFVSITVVVLSGCISQAARPYHACYFGERLKEACEATEVSEGRVLNCVDVAQETHFDLQDCDAHVKEKRYSFF